MSIQNKNGFQSLDKVIRDWKKDTVWIDGVPNDFIEKNVEQYNSINGEYNLIASIKDCTFYIDNTQYEFYQEASYPTQGMNHSMDDDEYDAKEFKKILDNLTNQMINAIKQQIAVWENEGKKITTSNPYGFK